MTRAPSPVPPVPDHLLPPAAPTPGAASSKSEVMPLFPAEQRSVDINAWRTKSGVGVQHEEEEREERVVLDGPRPLGFEIEPAEGSYGAIVTQSQGQAAAAGVEVGAHILCINDNPVEDMATAEIKGMLEAEALPLTLDLRMPLDMPTVSRRKKKRDPVTVYTAGCRGSWRVVSEAIDHLGWVELQTSQDLHSKQPSVVWVEHSDPTEGIAPVQTVSRLEAFLHFCKKARLAKSLGAWCEILPEVFAFSPQTWVLPYDAMDLRTSMTKAKKEDTFIVKPTAGAQGKGIILARKFKDIEGLVQRSKASQDSPDKATIEYVVQRYLGEPLLLDGLKFDMRLYVIVTSVVPLRAYLFKEGLARFCTVPYEAPQDGNLREARMHLTNFAVNKKSKDFQQNEGLAQHDEGSKRSASGTLRQIEQAFGASPDEIWSKVASLTANTLMALRPSLVEFYVCEQPRPLHPLGPKGFQLIGLDVLIDQDLEPRLLELNANPSLSATQPVSEKDKDKAAAAAAEDSEAEVQLEKAGYGAASSSAPLPPASSVGSMGLAASSSTSALPLSPPLPLQMPQQLLQAPLAVPPELSPSSSARLMQPPARNTGGMRGQRARSSVALGAPLRSNEDVAHVASSSSAKRAGSAEPPAPRGFMQGGYVAAGATSSGGAPSNSAPSGGGRKGRRHQSRSRAGGGESKRDSSKDKDSIVVSELDLEIKRELVVQALLLARPAPLNKTTRLKKQWRARNITSDNIVPLTDQGTWALGGKPTRAEGVRQDAPDRCPALEAINFEALAAPEVLEYAKSHLLLYRLWTRGCGTGRDSLGQAQVMKMFEKGGLVGDGNSLWSDRVTAQLWLSRVWRELAPGVFGLTLPQFVTLAGRIGRMLQSGGVAVDQEPLPSKPFIPGVLEFTRRGFAM